MGIMKVTSTNSFNFYLDSEVAFFLKRQVRFDTKNERYDAVFSLQETLYASRIQKI
jgi:hypothetical protein